MGDVSLSQVSWMVGGGVVTRAVLASTAVRREGRAVLSLLCVAVERFQGAQHSTAVGLTQI